MSFYTVKEMAMRYPVSISLLRKMIRNPEKYGVEDCIIRIENVRRVYFDDLKFSKIFKPASLAKRTPQNGSEAKLIKARTYNRPNFDAFSSYDESSKAVFNPKEEEITKDDEDDEQSFDF